MTTAPGSVTLPSAKTFVAKRLDAIRQTINSTAISMKTTDTFLFMFLFFKWFPRVHSAQPTFNTGRALYVKLFFFAGGLETLCVLGYLELVYTLLDIAIHECRKIIHRPVDTMIGHTGLRIVICTNLR